MKFYVNLFLIIVILAATIISPKACQEQTSMDETLTNKTSTNETIPLIESIQESIIVIPDRSIFTSCPEGQKKDHHGQCRQVI